jgi:ribosomal protein S18 acetylase RimI-like enzyme
MFEQHFELVSKDNPASGKIALIPWDIETFGFPVADFQIDYTPRIERQSEQIRKDIEVWARVHKVELIGITVPSEDISKLSFIQSLGFCYIDTTLSLHYKDVQKIQFPSTKVGVLPADKAALGVAVEICNSAFSSGRYYADIRFPKHLADKRYQDWVRRAFSAESPQQLFTAEVNGQVCAFMVLEANEKEGYLHLAAVTPQLQGQKIGLGLYASSLIYLQKQGVDLVHAKVSASNIRVLNLHTRLGAKCVNSQILFHWHFPWAEHLLIGNKNERD